jgi:hypothetical protein
VPVRGEHTRIVRSAGVAALLLGCSGGSEPAIDGGAITDATTPGDAAAPGPSCLQNLDCPDAADFCQKDSCDPAAHGVCTPMPGTRATGYCQPQTDFVCGCDGRTYENPCLAHARGLNVASQGPCAVPEGGAPCAADADCGSASLYCKKASCAAATGTCAGKPDFQVCAGEAPDGGQVACGCDHQTYADDCEAASYGINVAFEGTCPPLPSGPCTSQSDCGDPSYEPLVFCKPATCSAPAGTCSPVPGACPALYAPVCGCDGKVYQNECFADRARVGSYPSDAGCFDQ